MGAHRADASNAMRYPGSHHAYPSCGYKFSSENHYLRTTNWSCNVLLEETWTGYVTINAPQS